MSLWIIWSWKQKHMKSFVWKNEAVDGNVWILYLCEICNWSLNRSDIFILCKQSLCLVALNFKHLIRHMKPVDHGCTIKLYNNNVYKFLSYIHAVGGAKKEEESIQLLLEWNVLSFIHNPEFPGDKLTLTAVCCPTCSVLNSLKTPRL